MKKISLFIAVLTCSILSFGQSNNQEEYNRSSLYTITLLHSGDQMYNEILTAAQSLTIPDKYNDHSLNLRILQSDKEKGKMLADKDENAEKLTAFLSANQVAKRMVARWFDRDITTGAFDVETLIQRGQYNVSSLELQKSMYTVTGKSYIADADAELMPQTFVVINDITYVDKEKNAKIAGAVFKTLGSIAGQFFGGIGSLIKSAADLASSISDLVAGFTIDVRSYLFQLEWNPEVSNTFYTNYFYDADHVDLQKKAAFEADTTTFKMKYIGTFNARSEKTSPRGLYAQEEVFRKVLARATDKNIVELQKQYDVFKVTSIVTGITNKNEVYVPIGLKEGVSATSKYEVLERVVDKTSIKYIRRAVITPKAQEIWDNRYMAKEEEAKNADLQQTTFTIQSQLSPIYAGMLVREIK